MHPNQKIKFSGWHMKIDSSLCMATDFDCMSVPQESSNENGSMQKLVLNKKFAIDYNLVKTPDYDDL